MNDLPNTDTPEFLFAALIAQTFPSLFAQPSFDEFGDFSLVAHSDSLDPLCSLHVQSSFEEASVGLGSLAHTHFNFDQLEAATDLIERLISGQTGCYDQLDIDGKLISSQFIDRIQAHELPTAWHERAGKARLRFFSGEGNCDFPK